MTITHWSASDDAQWLHYREGIAILYETWVNRAVEEFCQDPAMASAVPEGEEPSAWFRTNLEKHRVTFLGSPNDPEIRENSRRVGFVHIHAHILPSWYVTLYNLLFDAYHSLEGTMDRMPPLPLVRRRWLADMRTTLDTYETVLSSTLTRLDDLARTDALTGFLNRRGIQQRITEDLGQGTKAAFFALIDLDHYKAINDGFGHPFGDNVLIRFATTTQSVARTTDALGRVGGDEFIWWLRDMDSVPTLISRITALDHAMTQECPTTFSVGIARYPQDGFTYDELYRVADRALYRAKQAGRHAYALSGANPVGFQDLKARADFRDPE